jgi:hypothetical protein
MAISYTNAFYNEQRLGYKYTFRSGSTNFYEYGNDIETHLSNHFVLLEFVDLSFHTHSFMDFHVFMFHFK